LILACKPDPSTVVDPTPAETGDSALHDSEPGDSDLGDSDPRDSDPDDSADSGTPTGSVAASLDLGEAVACADPSLRDSLGPFEAPDLGPDWAAQSVGPRWPTLTLPAPGYGLAVADLDGDGPLDIFLPNYGLDQLFLAQPDGTYEDVTAARWGGDDLDRSEAAVAADVDGDGDLDLVVFNRSSGNQVFLNDGAGAFTEQAAALDPVVRASVGGSLADFDGDGDLDLVVANHFREEEPHELTGGDPDELYAGRGDGTFASANQRWPPGGFDAYTFLATAVDMDVDGLPDIYLSRDFGVRHFPNQLLRNPGDPVAMFEDVSEPTYMGVGLGAMGVGLGDVNGDAIPDLLIANWGTPFFMESLPDGTWYQSEATRGIDTPNGKKGYNATWGTYLSDVDNDGDLDAPMAAGQVMSATTERNLLEQPDYLWIQEGGVFEDVAAAWGVADGANHRGLVVADLNRDGWLDLIYRDLNGPARVWRARCGGAGWLGLTLSQPGPNPRAVGAVVEARAGGRVMRRWVVAGGTGFAGGGPPEAHFGLGEAEAVDHLLVTWPDGETSVVSDVAGRQWATLRRLE